MRKPAAAAAFAVFALLGPVVAEATPIARKNAVSGNWNTPGNWNPAQVPTSADDVSIVLSGTYTVTVDVAASANSLTLGGASGTQTLAIGSQTLTLAATSSTGVNSIVTLAGGTLNGAGNLGVSGQLSWTGGAMSGSGTTTIAS